jgi:anti-sigma B factor antagonist
MIERIDDGGLRRLKVRRSRLDAAAAPAFRSQAIDEAAGGRRILLDVSEVGFVDSTGLGGFVSLLKSLEPQTELAVGGVQPNVRRLFSMTKLDRVFRLYDSVDEAERALAGRPG